MAENDVMEQSADMRGQVLVVDDVRSNRFVLERMLARIGCTVTSVDNGESALRVARESPPDLALVDVMMPDMDGYEVCRRLKADLRTQDTPVIMVTALTEIEDLETGFDAGAMDYICRPFNPRELVVRVRNALQLKHQGDRLRRFQERMSHELELAGALQATMLSVPPLLSHDLYISTAYRPSFNVSGDLFDRVLLPSGRYCVYVADVAGHGVAAAMLSSLLKAIFTDVLQSAGGWDAPSALCNEVDTRFRRSVTMRSAYATAFMGIYDPASRLWYGMNCGHPSPIMISPGGECTRPFEAGGSMPIGCGLLGDAPYTQEDEVSLRVEPGSLLFLYTDGLIEAQAGGDGEECGIDHLEVALQAAVQEGDVLGSCSRVMDRLHQEEYFLSADDCTTMVVEFVDPDHVVYAEAVSADLHAIGVVADTVEKALEARGWSEQRAAAFRLVFAEYCNNTVIHGGCDEDDVLSIRVFCSGKFCTLHVRDPGPEWDYPQSSDQVGFPEELSEGGRGLAIIYELVDHPRFYREEGQNVAILPVPRYAVDREHDNQPEQGD
jgi:sigma-B regulation protein RsbU (phosphoserine phosphatase)